MKKTINIIVCVLAVALAVASCKEKKMSDDIIVEKTVKKAVASTQRTGDYSDSRTVDWSGQDYTVSVSRKADETLPKVADDEGREYFDNSVELAVTRADGSEFFAKRFTKNFFAQYLPDNYLESNVLTGIVLLRAEAGRLLFIASVGSPDPLSDEYIPLRMAISRTGEISVERSSQIDIE